MVISQRQRTKLQVVATMAVALALSAGAAIAYTAVGIALLVEGAEVIWSSGLKFLTSGTWNYRTHEFGARLMVSGSLIVAFLAVLIGGSIGIGASILISELLPRRLKAPIKYLCDLLSGVPSVVFGLLGVTFLNSFIYMVGRGWGMTSGDSLLAGGVLLAFMILPTVVCVSEGALSSVSPEQRMASRALGATAAETAIFVCLPQASPGIIAALLLGLGRALGETIAVFMVIGRRDNMPSQGLLRGIIEPGQTLTTKIGSGELFIAYGDETHWSALMSLAFILLAISLTTNMLAGILYESLGTKKHR